MLKKTVSALLFIFFITPLMAQTNDDFEGTLEENLIPPDLTELIDYNMSNNTKNGFSPHKQNYILLFTYSGLSEDDGRQKIETKFQVSLKQRLLKFYGWAIYLGYTQKSFWQSYDFNASSPFRENNFDFEFFSRTKMWDGLKRKNIYTI